jgi:hypothetical protein
LSAVGATFGNIHGRVQADLIGSREWASVTFAGARHHVRLGFRGVGAVGAAADFLLALPELELTMPGHLVADVALLAEERRDGGAHAVLDLEVLTIEDQ